MVNHSHAYSSRQAPLKHSDYLLWTRMQAEAGQALDLILRRKEKERRAGAGHFFWGVGNAPAVIINPLARTGVHIPVVFSKMKTKPKAIDQNPSKTIIWRRYIDCEGKVRPLPSNALITSRGTSSLKTKRSHYALECFSRTPLVTRSSAGIFDPLMYRNASGTGAPVGASQVTSLLVPNPIQEPNKESAYTVDMTAALTGSYWVKLVDPLTLTSSALSLIDQADFIQDDWLEFVEELRHGPGEPITNDTTPVLL